MFLIKYKTDNKKYPNFRRKIIEDYQYINTDRFINTAEVIIMANILAYTWPRLLNMHFFVNLNIILDL